MHHGCTEGTERVGRLTTNGHEWTRIEMESGVQFRACRMGNTAGPQGSVEAEFHFTLGPMHARTSLGRCAISWAGHRVFCNPPYGRTIGNWLAKGREADLAVFLIPSRTDTAWFHDYALKADEIRFFRGRLKFAENHVAPAQVEIAPRSHPCS